MKIGQRREWTAGRVFSTAGGWLKVALKFHHMTGAAMIKMPFAMALVLLAASACASRSERVAPQTGGLADAGVGAVVSGAPGETLYTETAGRHGWELVMETGAEIGGYTVEPGAYAISAAGPDGYFFTPGDSCLGEPSVRAGRFADAPAALYRPNDTGELCVATVFDTLRCAPMQSVMRPAPLEGEPMVTYRLIYDGPVAPTDGGPDRDPDALVGGVAEDFGGAPADGRELRFIFEAEDAGAVTRTTATASASGLLEYRAGRFQVLFADAGGVYLAVLHPIQPGGPITPPPLLGAPEIEADMEAGIEEVATRTLETMPGGRDPHRACRPGSA